MDHIMCVFKVIYNINCSNYKTKVKDFWHIYVSIYQPVCSWEGTVPLKGKDPSCDSMSF